MVDLMHYESIDLITRCEDKKQHYEYLYMTLFMILFLIKPLFSCFMIHISYFFTVVMT